MADDIYKGLTNYGQIFIFWIWQLQLVIFTPQFVDTLFIVRWGLNMSMRRAVIIIIHFLVQKVELKIYYRLLEFCLGLTKSPWHNLKVKRAQN